MEQRMVTGRMSKSKKEKAVRILNREGLNASSAINMMFDRIIDSGSTDFLRSSPRKLSSEDWKSAADFVDSLSAKRQTRFDDMTKAEIKMDRLKNRGLS